MAFDPSVIGIDSRSTLFSSNTRFSLTARQLTVTSNGDPFPALAGNPLTDSLPRQFDNREILIKDQSYDFVFNYRAGRNVQNPQAVEDSPVAILANGAVIFGAKYNPRTLPLISQQIPDSLSFDPVQLQEYLFVDPAGGNINNQGQYHYRSGQFLTTAWNTVRFRESNSYYNGSNFQGDRFRHPDGHSKILGYCLDGYPIYGPYAYRNPNDQLSAVVQMKSSYSVKTTDLHRPGLWKYDSEILKINNEPVDLSGGAFVEDYIYIRNQGTLDEHNGRFCITPEYPQGTYAYFLTFKDSDLSKPAYPYVVGPFTKQARTLLDKPQVETAEPVDSLWTLPSGSTISRLRERLPVGIKLPVTTRNDVEVELISGSLPRGTRLEGSQIVGTAFEVAFETVSTFVLRARRGDYFEDRTYRIITVGADAPEWLTPEGTLPIGPNGLAFVLDNAIIDFQLSAIDRDLPAGDELEFFIAEGDGELPPGITLTRDGKLQGITEPLLSIDQRFESGGYDTNPYGGFPFDFGLRDDEKDITVRPQRKLNRYFPFAVTVTDGITFSRREFQIFLVGDDFLRSDNTIMKIATGVFTADNTFIRTPVWLTDRDLGIRRANNYLTVYLDILNTPNLAGVITYTLDPINDDGSPSELPPGTQLDTDSGEIIGRVPYQPAVSENYKFTVRATRYAARPGIVTVFANFFEDTLLGRTSFKIFKIDLTGDEDGVNDLLELVDRKIVINNRVYTVVNVDDSDEDFDVIFLDRTLSPEISLITSRLANAGDDFIFVNRLNEKETEKYLGRTLKFSQSEKYKITDIVPYIEYEIDQPADQNTAIVIDVVENAKIDQTYFTNNYVLSEDGSVYKSNLTQILENLSELINSEKWTFISNSLTSMPVSDKINATTQKLTEQFTGPVYIQAISQSKWRVKLPSTAKTRTISNIRNFFTSAIEGVGIRTTFIRDNEQRFQFDVNLNKSIQQGNNIGIALFARDGFSKSFASTLEDEVSVPSKAKTFEIKIIGEIDSTIRWITPSNLGTIDANFTSILNVQAEADIPDIPLIYQIVDGKLPAGMRLSVSGEIIGVANQFADDKTLGLTTFDKNSVSWDGVFPGDTSFDREFRFTVRAQDRFRFAEIDQEFVLRVEDLDNTVYTDIYMKPMLKPQQRQYFNDFISNSNIFEPEKIYRPSDLNFGIKNDLKMLVFAGIEAKKIDEFVAAAAKNHKRKQYLLGEFKTAVAKLPGSNQVEYEVVYIQVKDPAEPDQGKAREKFIIQTKNKITADSIQFTVKDDETKSRVGYNQIPIQTRLFVNFVFVENNKIIIDTKQSGKIVDTAMNSFQVQIRESENVSVKIDLTDSEPQRLRPTTNTVKADSNAIKVSDSKDQTKYLSNLRNMRTQIKNIGEIQRRYLPLWMRTPQEDLSVIGYTSAIPICYCKPGTSKDILLNIKNSQIDLSVINFDIDRYIVERSDGIGKEQIILFANYQFNV
jgi:hypothetical protein